MPQQVVHTAAQSFAARRRDRTRKPDISPAPIVIIIALTVIGLYFVARRLVYDVRHPGRGASPLEAVGMIALSVVSGLLYAWLVSWLDRNEKEPWRLIVSILLVGAVAAPGLTTAVGNALRADFLGVPDEFFGPDRSGPLIEEALKGILVLLLFLGLRREFDGPVDGIVYGALVGLGFAVSENAAYMIEKGFRHHLLTRIVLRGLAGHPTYTALTGIGLGIARTIQKRSQVPGTGTAGPRRHRTVAALSPVIGFVLAVAAHMIWNRLNDTFAACFWGFVRAIVVLNLPFVALVGLGLWLSLQKEDEVVRRYLPADMYDHASYTSQPDFVTARARYQARRRAAWTIGRPKARLVLKLQRALIEIAFWLRYAAREKLDASTFPELGRLQGTVMELRGKITEASQMAG